MELKTSVNFKSIGVSLIIVLITLELSPFILGSFFLQEGYSRHKIRQQIEQNNGNDTTLKAPAVVEESYLSEHIVHPYLGFIHKPDDYYNIYGYPLDSPILVKSDTVINICLTGGSVAKQLFQNSTGVLIQEIKRDSRFSDKNINIISAALGGYKQPQQLMAINYLISLGAEYDYVINLDGFNEVVLPYADNLPFQIHPTFPRHWNVYSRKTLNQDAVRLLGLQMYTRESRANKTRKFAGSLLSFSNFALFVWQIKEQNVQARLMMQELELRKELSETELQMQTTGPSFHLEDTVAFFQYQADYWRQCSQQMAQLSVGGNFTYLHFLQPNQYVEGSKTLTSEEMETSYATGDYAYKTAVRLGYPLLKASGIILQENGVYFSDLTMLFHDEKASVYSDECCHFNQKGYDAIARQIAQTILEVTH